MYFWNKEKSLVSRCIVKEVRLVYFQRRCGCVICKSPRSFYSSPQDSVPKQPFEHSIGKGITEVGCGSVYTNHVYTMENGKRKDQGYILNWNQVANFAFLRKTWDRLRLCRYLPRQELSKSVTFIRSGTQKGQKWSRTRLVISETDRRRLTCPPVGCGYRWSQGCWTSEREVTPGTLHLRHLIHRKRAWNGR